MTTAIAPAAPIAPSRPITPPRPVAPRTTEQPSIPVRPQWDWSPEPEAIRAWVASLPRHATIGECCHSNHCVVAEYILAGQHLFGVTPPSLLFPAPSRYLTVEVTPETPKAVGEGGHGEILIERWGDYSYVAHGPTASVTIPMSPALNALANAYDALDSHPENPDPHVPTRDQVLGLFR